MSSYIRYNNDLLLLPHDCSLSFGNSCETKESRSSDGTSRSYSITTFKKPAANTYTLGFVRRSVEYPNLLEELYAWEQLVGKVVEFSYCNIPFGQVIIESLSVSFNLDATTGIKEISLSFSMKENIVIQNKTQDRLNVILDKGGQNV